MRSRILLSVAACLPATSAAPPSATANDLVCSALNDRNAAAMSVRTHGIHERGRALRPGRVHRTAPHWAAVPVCDGHAHAQLDVEGLLRVARPLAAETAAPHSRLLVKERRPRRGAKAAMAINADAVADHAIQL